MPISSPFNSPQTSVYAVVVDGNCISDVVEVTLNISDEVQAFSTTAEQCTDGSGMAVFDLSFLESDVINGGNGDLVSWFSDAGAMSPIINPILSLTTTTKVYAVVTNGTCLSDIVAVTLEVVAEPTAFSASDESCDDGTGMATFDLINLENTITGGSGLPVTWLDNASTGGNSITPPYTTASTTIFAVVTNGS